MEAKKEMVAVSELRLDPDNAVEHDKWNRQTIAASFQRWGQYRPLVVDTGRHDRSKRGVIRAGNLLYELMVEQEVDEVWVEWKDFASETEARAFAIADNKSGELKRWRWEVLSEQLGEIEDKIPLVELGFQDYETEPLLAATFIPAPIVEPDDHAHSEGDRTEEPSSDDPTKTPVRRANRVFQVYVTVAEYEELLDLVKRLQGRYLTSEPGVIVIEALREIVGAS